MKRLFDGLCNMRKNLLLHAIIISFLFFLSPIVHAEEEKSLTYTDSVTGMEFVLVKGGCFDMGDIFGDGDGDERPVHEVCVDDFYMGKYEVTQGQWEEVMKNNPSKYRKGKNHPVARVSWYDIQNFIRNLNVKAGRHYRLPAEAEWEYAARSGGKRYKYSWGNGGPEGNIAGDEVKMVSSKRTRPIWDGHYDKYVYSAPVGSFRVNEFGLYDMTGNLWEWCSDWYGADFYRYSPVNNPKGPSGGSSRILRGGSWNNGPGYVRISFRNSYTPNNGRNAVGFRLAMTPR